MLTVKECILGIVLAQNPCDCNAIKNEVYTQQTEIDKSSPLNINFAIDNAMNELIKDGKIVVAVCGSDIVLDLPI